jgi:hypothetical protein
VSSSDACMVRRSSAPARATADAFCHSCRCIVTYQHCARPNTAHASARTPGGAHVPARLQVPGQGQIFRCDTVLPVLWHPHAACRPYICACTSVTCWVNSLLTLPPCISHSLMVRRDILRPAQRGRQHAADIAGNIPLLRRRSNAVRQRRGRINAARRYGLGNGC